MDVHLKSILLSFKLEINSDIVHVLGEYLWSRDGMIPHLAAIEKQ